MPREYLECADNAAVLGQVGRLTWPKTSVVAPLSKSLCVTLGGLVDAGFLRLTECQGLQAA